MAEKRGITFLFRKRSPHFNSIEEIFYNLIPALSGQFNVEKVHLEHFSNGLLNKVRNVLFVKRLKSELIHITGEVYYTGLLTRRKLVVTVHDMGSLNTGNKWKREILRLLWFQWIADKADAITLISEQSKKEYLEHVRIDPSKLFVIPNPVPPGFAFSPKERFPDKPVILQIGTKPNKNLPRVAGALNGLPCRLVIIGALKESDRSVLNSNHIEYENLVGITHEEMRRQYEACDIVLFVSTYEGFGMPVIEAQSVGRPVLTSNIPPMSDVAGEGAVLVDPLSVYDIRQGLNKIIRDADLRKQLVKAGQENIRRFGIDTIAEQYTDLYKKVYGKA